MSSLKEIRTRIHSVDNIKKITKTMEMVAASQLRKAQLKAEQSRPYTQKLKQILDHVSMSEFISAASDAARSRTRSRSFIANCG